MTEPVYVATELASVGKISIATEYFYIMTGLAKARKNYVVTEIICVTTKLAAIEISIAHDRAGCAQAKHERLTHNAHGSARDRLARAHITGA